MEDTKRRVFVDIARGLAIFLMLWGHCIQYCVANSGLDFFENGVFKTIYSFHMPLFMLISGYLFYFSFSKRDLGQLLTHRVQSLLQPIVFCSIFNFLVTDVLFGLIAGNYGILFDGGWINSLSSLWFLWSVLAASIVVAVVCKKFSNIFVQILMLGIAMLIVAMFPNMTLNLYMYPYFVLGFYYAEYKEKFPRWLNNFKYITIALFPIMLCFYEKKHYIYTTGLFGSEYSRIDTLLIDTYRWAIGLVGSVCVLTVVEIIYEKLISKIGKPVISIGLAKLGKKSLQIYAFSVPFLSAYLSVAFPKVLSILNIDNVFTRNIFVYNFIFTLLLSIIYSFVLYFLVRIFEKLKISKVIFGK